MSQEKSDYLRRPDEEEVIGGSNAMEIVGHNWKLGQVHFKVKLISGYASWGHLKDTSEDYPRMSAQCITRNNVIWSKYGGDRVLQWAKKVERDMARTMQRIIRLYDLYLDKNDDVKRIRRTQNKKKRKFSIATRH